MTSIPERARELAEQAPPLTPEVRARLRVLLAEEAKTPPKKEFRRGQHPE